jgi:hypothetical protein
MAFDSSKRKCVDEEPDEIDDDVHVVHDILMMATILVMVVLKVVRKMELPKLLVQNISS